MSNFSNCVRTNKIKISDVGPKSVQNREKEKKICHIHCTPHTNIVVVRYLKIGSYLVPAFDFY